MLLAQRQGSNARWLRALLAFAVLLVPTTLILTPGVGAEGVMATYRITLQNQSNQVFSPPVFIAHHPDMHVFAEGHAASDALRMLAENGDNVPLAEAAGAHGAYAVEALEAGLNPGESVTVEITAPKLNSRISVGAMLVYTNDGFTGINSAPMPGLLGGYERHLGVYDAGTEMNNELMAHVPGLGGTERDPESNLVMHHPGITGAGDLDPAVWGWSGAVAKLTITRADIPYGMPGVGRTADYQARIENPNNAQVFSPPILVVHRADVRLFELGETASDGILTLAEMGDNSALAEMVMGMDGIYAVEQLSDGVNPGTSIEIDFSAPVQGYRVTVLMMLVWTNDGFTGANGSELPAIFEAIEVEGSAYDAGTEMNNELATHVPGLDGTERDPDMGVVAMHPGIAGVGDLDPSVWGWSGPASLITLSRAN